MIELVRKLISTNKISSVEVADALNKSGVLKDIKPLNNGDYIVGKIHYVCTWQETNWPLHQQIQEVAENDIIYVDTVSCEDRAVLGDIICKQLFLYQKVGGLIVNGYIRDAHRLIKEKYPIWSKGITPLGCINKFIEPNNETQQIIEKQRKIFDGSLIVCDDSGCTLIEKKHMTNDLINNLEYIELQEDIWYYCLDTLKMNSYDIICKKKYLKDEELLPKKLLERLRKFEVEKSKIKKD